MDWLAHNLAVEGEDADAATAGSLLRTDVATCRPGDRAGEARVRIESSPYGFALLTTSSGVLLGRLPRSALEGDPGVVVEQLAEPGPSTLRPHTPTGELSRRLAERDLRVAIVTTPEGRLLGVVRREDAEPER